MVTPLSYGVVMDTKTAPSTPVAAQPALFDADAHEPIPYALTARARREVAPQVLPDLRVIGAPAVIDPRSHGAGEQLDDPRDTRAARARALRRAGLDLADIARQLDVDELIVRAWVGDVAVDPELRRRIRAGAAGGRELSAPEGAEHDEARAAFELARAAACDEALDNLATDPGFAAGLGLVAATADIGLHALIVSTSRREVLAALLRWLAAYHPVEAGRIRLVLRLGPGVAGDLARHAWSGALGLPADAVTSTRWRAAPDDAAVEALLRIADPVASATLAGWCDALLEPPSDLPDVPGGF